MKPPKLVEVSIKAPRLGFQHFPTLGALLEVCVSFLLKQAMFLNSAFPRPPVTLSRSTKHLEKGST